ncbi:uncharacterized protein FPRO_13794 [Fusarium proliferatum ET1]|uniref:F-box domain-containing protein n=1 Tax=Fusarium proliferatum (strain ET1) TaxID=1227346 RepID=A0A1L7VV65_FUSPR|nr:uncharacterized protein FPRO_13794 [Fusarium proliferatum ET1]CZR43986.1 uncharacterized protein FPRO_13794 [Fusarium proliferatum ET1]
MTSTDRNSWCAICGVTINSHIIRFRLMWPNGFSTYDPDVVSDADVGWLDQVHFLGYNPLATTSSKFYVSDPAIIGRGIEMATETRTDPAFAGVEVRTLRVYRNKKGPERVIPFHWECYKTLALYLTGTSDTTRIRKGALYRVLERFLVVRDFQRQADYWECIPGQEYTVFSPQCQVQLKGDMAAYISGPEFEKPSQYHCKSKANSNPLTLLPETVISGVSEFLDNESLINLFCASLETYSSLRDSGSFWKRRIITHLPYFLELHEYLKEHSQNLEDRDFRKIFLWADAASKPQFGVTRLMFPVANRRRIWKVCEQIEELYNQEPRQKGISKRHLGCQVHKSERQVLGDTGEPGLHFRSANFIQQWSGLLCPWTLGLFWNSEGDLSGIAVTFGRTQRIFGHEPKESGACRTAGSFAGGVWIKGFVFHIYASSALRPWQSCSWNYSSCKGVTVHLTDGSEHTYGQGDEHLLRMPFAATENMAIVGIKGTLTVSLHGTFSEFLTLRTIKAHKRHAISPFIEKVRFLQAATNGEHFSREPLKHRDQEVTSWNPVNCMFRNLISPTDDLELNLCKGRVRKFDRWHCLVPLNTLVLANDASELSQIRSISAYIIRDPIYFNIWNNHCDVGNLRITTDTETRYLRNMDDDGSIWPGQRWDTFHIDGPGGEIIEQVIVHHALFRDPSPKAIETCTNRGRSVIWGVDMERGEYGDETNKPCPPNMSHRLPTHLRPDDGFTIVGLTMGCGKVFGRWHSDEYQVERSKAPDCHSYSRRLKDKGEDYVDEKDSRGPWTKEQYDRRNESTIHTGMSKFGIITKRITGSPGRGI